MTVCSEQRCGGAVRSSLFKRGASSFASMDQQKGFGGVIHRGTFVTTRCLAAKLTAL
jgi:hypothetical protein